MGCFVFVVLCVCHSYVFHIDFARCLVKCVLGVDVHIGCGMSIMV